MKSVRTAADFAINGAPPAFSQPLHVGRPNTGNQAAFAQLTQGMFDRNQLTNNGPLVVELERRIASLHDVQHCVAMGNGTIALEIAIRALGLTGEVIVPAYTFIATAHALSWQGLTPVFADIDPATHNLSPAAVRNMITPRTTGIIGVHLWGRPAPAEALQKVADEHGLQLMFDAAHAFACSHKGKKIGSLGRCEVLSFHATKVFNTFEGGAVLTNDDQLADTMRLMRNFGFSGLDNVIHPGTNGKLSEIHAAMGLVNLDALPDFIDANRTRYQKYVDVLAQVPGVSVISYDPEDDPNYQYVVIELSDQFPLSRDKVIDVLHAENIRARKYFWPGCHRMQPYRELFPHARLLLQGTEVVADRTIVLPTGPSLGMDEVGTVAAVIAALASQSN